MAFPTFGNLIPTLTYRPPGDRRDAYDAAKAAILALDLALSSAITRPAPGDRFPLIGSAVGDFARTVAPLLPTAHADATAAMRQLNIVRMFATRAAGGALPDPDGLTVRLGAEGYARGLATQVQLLDIAIATAITTQP